MMRTAGSLFSGAGFFCESFRRAGFDLRWQVEIDKDARDVLTRHFPDVPKYEDVRLVGAHNLEPVDVIFGGSPCTDVSHAGKREGLAGERSGLIFEFVRIVSELKPPLILIENVPGLVSSHGGSDFRLLLRSLLDIGATDICWRLLDGNHWGVPQRRKRIFLVADFVDERAGSVLLERESVCGHPAKSGKARKKSAAPSGGGTAVGRGSGLIASDGQTVTSLTANYGSTGVDARDAQAGHLIAESVVVPILESGARQGSKSDKRDGLGVGKDGDPMFTLQAAHQHAVAIIPAEEAAHTITAGGLGRPGASAAGRRQEDDFNLVVSPSEETAHTVTSRYGKGINTTVDDGAVVVESEPFIFESRIARNGRGAPESVCPPLKAQSGLTGKGDSAPLVVANEAYQCHGTNVGPMGTVRAGNGGVAGGVPFLAVDPPPVSVSEDQRGEINMAPVTQSLTHGGGKPGQGYPAVLQRARVRRLTPVELERLQGAPDDWTRYGASGKEMSVTARCRMVGNAGVIPCVSWIASRLLAVL